MKKEFLVAVSVLFGMAASLSVSAQEKLSLKQCREMALKYNKEMAAADKQTEAARLLSLSYKANFFPNFTASGTGLYSTADGSGHSGRKSAGIPARSRYWRVGNKRLRLFPRIESGL